MSTGSGGLQGVRLLCWLTPFPNVDSSSCRCVLYVSKCWKFMYFAYFFIYIYFLFRGSPTWKKSLLFCWCWSHGTMSPRRPCKWVVEMVIDGDNRIFLNTCAMSITTKGKPFQNVWCCQWLQPWLCILNVPYRNRLLLARNTYPYYLPPDSYS